MTAGFNCESADAQKRARHEVFFSLILIIGGGGMTAEEFLTMTVTQTFLAKVLGLTQGRISQLLDEGILIRDEESRQPLFYDSLKNYWLSKKTTGDGVNFWTERALHEKAKRQLAELKYQERCNELYEAATVEDFLTELITNARNKFLGVAPKLSPQLEGKSAAQIYELVDGEIRDILMELAAGAKSGDYKADADSVGAAALDDNLDVGG